MERPQRSEDERPCGGRAPSEDCSSKAVDFILTLGVVSSPNSVSANKDPVRSLRPRRDRGDHLRHVGRMLRDDRRGLRRVSGRGVSPVSLMVVGSGGAVDGSWVRLLQACALGGWVAAVWLAGRLCRWRRWIGHSGWHAGRCKLIEGGRFGWRVAVLEPPLLAGTYDHSDIFRGRLPSPPTEGFVWIVRGSRRKVLLLSPGSLVVRQVRPAPRERSFRKR